MGLKLLLLYLVINVEVIIFALAIKFRKKLLKKYPKSMYPYVVEASLQLWGAMLFAYYLAFLSNNKAVSTARPRMFWLGLALNFGIIVFVLVQELYDKLKAKYPDSVYPAMLAISLGIGNLLLFVYFIYLISGLNT